MSEDLHGGYPDEEVDSTRTAKVMESMRGRYKLTNLSNRLLYVVLAAALLSMSCGGGNQSSQNQTSTGLPNPNPAGEENSYRGTQSSGDNWEVSINHSANSFSALDLTNSSSGTITGSIVQQLNFLSLAQTNVSQPFQPFGFALEIPGRVMTLRPGNNLAPVTALVPGTCLKIGGSTTFQFVALPSANWPVDSGTAYGSVVANTDGTTWALSSFHQFTLAQSEVQPGLKLPSGACGSNGTINVPVGSGREVPATLAVGPSGFLVASQFVSGGQGESASGAVGTVQPSKSLNTRTVAAASYLGFEAEPALAGGAATTQMAYFGGSVTGAGCQASPSPTSMCGGVFANDNLASLKQANTDTTINLGSEDPANFGLYESATVTIPDPSGSSGTCVSPALPGTGSQGNPTCTLPAIAVVGNPESYFSVFVVAYDSVNKSPMTIYLLQQ